MQEYSFQFSSRFNKEQPPHSSYLLEESWSLVLLHQVWKTSPSRAISALSASSFLLCRCSARKILCDVLMAASGFDVVVIGAGIAGLQCARRLAAASLSILVLEARSRVGGRAMSTPEGVDLGPSWVWQGDTRVMSLLRELDMSMVPQRTDADAILQRGKQVQKVPASQGVGMIPCGPGAFRVSGGYAQAAERMAAGLPADTVRLSSRVVAVKKHSSAISVQYQSSGSDKVEEVLAQRVVLALPPSVIASSIKFEPALPAATLTRMSNTPTWAGDWTKIVVSCRTAFWRKRGLSGIAYSQDGLVTM
eukprot:2914788-Amphidinium_carterae.1